MHTWDFKGSFMKKLWKVPVLLIAAIISACSTIEEDRSLCPCWYTIDLTEVDRSVQNLYLWIFNQDGTMICNDTLQSGSYGKYEVKLDKGESYCYIWGNLIDSTILYNDHSYGSYFIKQDSCSSDPLFHYAKVLNTSGESGCDTVSLNKEYAQVNFTLKGELKVKGQLVMDINMHTRGRYIHGGFVEGNNIIHTFPQRADGDSSLFRFKMMRQESFEDVTATIAAVVDNEKFVVKHFPFGKWLVASGYDARAQNLGDITMELDLALGLLSIKSDHWQSVLPVKIEM